MTREGRTFRVIEIHPDGFVKGKRTIITLRRILTFYGIAFTVLDCAKCKWRMMFEAHHQYGRGNFLKGGKLRPITKQQKRRGYERPKMKRPGQHECPKCGNKTWHYVRTDVYDAGPACKLYSEVD